MFSGIPGRQHGTYRTAPTMGTAREKIIGDYSLYLWNVEGRDFWMQYLDGFCLPLELTAAEQKKIIDPAIPTEKLIYGKIPMMVTANCVTQTLDRCRKGEGGRILELTDRYHKRFPVMRNCTHCFNVIYNSVPLSLHKEADRQIVVGRLDLPQRQRMRLCRS